MPDIQLITSSHARADTCCTYILSYFRRFFSFICSFLQIVNGQLATPLWGRQSAVSRLFPAQKLIYSSGCKTVFTSLARPSLGLTDETVILAPLFPSHALCCTGKRSTRTPVCNSVCFIICAVYLIYFYCTVLFLFLF